MSGYGVEILALQEFKPTGFYNIDEIAGEFRFMSYNSIYNEDEEAIGMALFSKYPVLRSNKIKFENTGNGAMWADILYKGDTIRVINNHLQTTGYYSSYPKGLKYLVDIMSQNFIVRSEQAEIIRELIDTTSYPVIVMGDFNDTPNSFVYSTIKGDDLKDGFVEKGSGPGGTFRRTMGLLRIDMIFHSKHFESAGFTIGSDKLSDHKPVISVLEYKN
jgi:endonuclease/exonuclease/phosphatase family metal-dependent hydrolase